MPKMLISHAFRVALACIAALTLMLSAHVQGGQAGTQYQTIPTAPPPTATLNPTRVPTYTQANPPLPSATAAQVTPIVATQTAEAGASPTAVIEASPTSMPSATGMPGGGTIPQVTSIVPTMVGRAELSHSHTRRNGQLDP